MLRKISMLLFFLLLTTVTAHADTQKISFQDGAYIEFSAEWKIDTNAKDIIQMTATKFDQQEAPSAYFTLINMPPVGITYAEINKMSAATKRSFFVSFTDSFVESFQASSRFTNCMIKDASFKELNGITTIEIIVAGEAKNKDMIVHVTILMVEKACYQLLFICQQPAFAKQLPEFEKIIASFEIDE